MAFFISILTWSAFWVAGGLFGVDGPDPARGHTHRLRTGGGRLEFLIPEHTVYVTDGVHWIAVAAETVLLWGLVALICGGTAWGLATGIRLSLPRRATMPLTGDAVRVRLFANAWRDLRRREAIRFAVVGLGIVAVGLQFWLRIGALEAALVEMLVLVFIHFGLSMYLNAFPCPRCKDGYFRGAGRLTPDFCGCCGLPRNSLSASAVAPEFIERQARDRF